MQQSAKYLLIGGGVASVNAAIGIREHDKEGSIMLAGAETWMPYDRPPLSKAFLYKDLVADDITSKLDSFYPDNGIDLRLGYRATKLDLAKKTVSFENGESAGYEKLLIATGSRPKPLQMQGQKMADVFPLRTIDDALMIKEAMKGATKVVVVGAGFIGMEVASIFCTAGMETTVLCQEDRPWSLFGSERLGKFMQSYFEAKGVRFMTRETAAAIHPGPEVVTNAGIRIPCDFVVVGAGVDLNVEFALAGGLHGDTTHGITATKNLMTSDKDVYVAGDVAHFYDATAGTHWHCEHHLNARWQGQCAGANMTGADQTYDRVAYIYSDVFDIHMILRGDPLGNQDSLVLGDVDAGEFVELYYDETRRLSMGSAISHNEPSLDPISDKLDELIRAKAKVDEISAADFGL